MISKITGSISKFFGTADGQTAYNKYEQMTQTEGFEIHKRILVEVANGLLQYMVTQKFTDLEQRQKDVEQRAIFECKEIIDFLLDPLKGLKQHNRIAAHNKRMQQTVTGVASEKK